MAWCFGIVNTKLAELFFENKKGKINILGHCYVGESEYRTKKEKKWIKKDTQKMRLVYRNKKYRFLTN